MLFVRSFCRHVVLYVFRYCFLFFIALVCYSVLSLFRVLVISLYMIRRRPSFMCVVSLLRYLCL